MLDPSLNRRRATIVALGLVVLGLAGWFGWNAVQAGRAWNNVDRVEFDPQAVRATAPTVEPDDSGASPGDSYDGPSIGEVAAWQDAQQVYLVLGNDAKDDRDHVNIDALHLVIVTDSDPRLVIVSVSRDFKLPNPCSGELIKLTQSDTACPGFEGPTSTAAVLESWTRLEIDHYVELGFSTFVEVIDRIGGATLCVEYPIRFGQPPGEPDIEAGCSLVDGGTSLQWVRSRIANELVDGQWRAMPEVSARTRDERQVDLLLQVLRGLDSFGSIRSFGGVVTDIADSVVLDQDLRLETAVELAWSLRPVKGGELVRVRIPATPVTDSDGFHLIPDEPFWATITESWPDATRYLSGTAGS